MTKETNSELKETIDLHNFNNAMKNAGSNKPENNFHLPIHYIKNKYELNETTIKDLELLKTNNKQSLYNYAINPTTKFADSVVPLWAKYYTSDKKFLKDTQRLLKNFKNTIAFESDTEKAYSCWQKVHEETSFRNKYQYLDFKILEKLNENRYFLEVFSLYNLTTPLFTLILPIILLIIPFFIIKITGKQITIPLYVNLLKRLFRKHSLGQIISGNYSDNTLQRNVYLAFSFFLYLFQIYQNILSCIQFYKNITFIHETIFSLRNHYDSAIRSMDNLLKYTSNLKTYTPFNKVVMKHKETIVKLNKDLHVITPCRPTIKKSLQIGHVMEIFYSLYHNKEYKLATEYSFKFTGWLENIDGLKKSINNNTISFCKFSKKSTNFEDAYFPPTLETNSVTNTYNLNKNILITGPNAAGKTTLLKTTLFNIIISQQIGCGFYSHANIYLFDKIHCYINIPDTSNRDSLFQAEARRCKDILTDILCTPKLRHFCIFDELFSGTNPYEAISSAVSFLDYLNKQKNTSFILTTHFLDLCKQLENHDKIINRNMKIETKYNDEFNYTYKLSTGISNIRGGVKVLKQLNYPAEIISNTEKIIDSLKL